MERGNLVIARKIGESFDIGNDITITVLSGCDSKVRLSIEAPKSLQIIRDNAICREPKKAS